MRSFWPELDTSVATIPVKQVLLPDVSSIKIMYADASGQFEDIWPVPFTNGLQQTSALSPAAAISGVLPKAVSITLTLKDWGTITRIVEVATP